MQKIGDYISWLLLLLFAGPTFMIIISWQSVPGDPLYKMKLYLEQSLVLLVSPSRDTATDLQMKYTERRLEEAKTLLSRNQSSEGLTYLQEQIVSTGSFIAQSKSGSDQSLQATKYIETLQKVSLELEAQNTAITRGTPAISLFNQSTASQKEYPSTNTDEPKQSQPESVRPITTDATKNIPVVTPVKPKTTPDVSTTKPTPIQSTPLVEPTTPPVTIKPAPVKPPTVSQILVKREIEATQEKIKETIEGLERVKKESEENRNKDSEEKSRKQKKEQEKSEEEERKKKDRDRNDPDRKDRDEN